MHPHHDDPEVWVAANVVVMQPPMKTPAPLPGMTPPLKPQKYFQPGRKSLGMLHIGTGPTCPKCNCGRKKAE